LQTLGMLAIAGLILFHCHHFAPLPGGVREQDRTT
jgi:hypothetical protein